MRVKIGNTIYNSSETPVLLLLEEEDKLNISMMAPNSFKYLSYPVEMTQEEAKEFMKEI